MVVITRSSYEPLDAIAYYSITIDGREVMKFHDGEPEDNTLGRNFNDCYGIVDLMVRAHKAGLQGEDLKIERDQIKWEDRS